MNGAQIQAKVVFGYKKAGQYLGTTYVFHRPSGSGNPLSGSPLAALPADFPCDAATSYAAPEQFGKMIVYGLLDTTALLPGDYAVGQLGTLFMASQEPNVASMWVRCNRVMTFYRPLANTGGGTKPYGGVQRATENVYATQWPCSEVIGTKGEAAVAQLPNDTRQPWMAFLAPVTLPQVPLVSDQASDDLGRWWTISAVESTAQGYRLTGMLASA